MVSYIGWLAGGEGRNTHTYIHISFFWIRTNGFVTILGKKKVVFKFEMNEKKR